MKSGCFLQPGEMEMSSGALPGSLCGLKQAGLDGKDVVLTLLAYGVLLSLTGDQAEPVVDQLMLYANFLERCRCDVFLEK